MATLSRAEIMLEEIGSILKSTGAPACLRLVDRLRGLAPCDLALSEPSAASLLTPLVLSLADEPTRYGALSALAVRRRTTVFCRSYASHQTNQPANVLANNH